MMRLQELKKMIRDFIVFIVHPVSCFSLGLKTQTRIQIIYLVLVIVLNTFISQDHRLYVCYICIASWHSR